MIFFFKLWIRLLVFCALVLPMHAQARFGMGAPAPGSTPAQLPTSLGWFNFNISLTSPVNVCPANQFNGDLYSFNTHCGGVYAFSGGFADTTRNTLNIWGGGHSDYAGNEVYRFDLNTNPPTLARVFGPTTPSNTTGPDTVGGTCVETLGSQPNSRHTYQGEVYMPTVDRMWAFAGSLTCGSGGFSTATWHYNLSNTTWAQITATGAYTPNDPDIVADWDDVNKTVWNHIASGSGADLYEYNPSTTTYIRHATGDSLGGGTSAVIDSGRRRMYIFGRDTNAAQAFSYDLTQAIPPLTDITATLNENGCGGLITSNSPGLTFDTSQGKVLGFGDRTGNNVYLFDPDSNSCTTFTGGGGPLSANAVGLYGRFRYFPAKKVSIINTALNDSFYQLRLLPPPVLLFSDLPNGPNTGNTDTSQGQPSGVNGAIVSLWGQNLGTSQGSSTVTINGSTSSAIYFWGNASASAPANLNNGPQNLQLVIFQVPSTATTGPGTISVIVNGQTSNTIPFTVRAGRIFFVATTGNDANSGTWQAPFLTITHARDQMTTAGDILYIESGVNQTTQDDATGFALQVCVQGTAAAPMTLAAYPGASPVFGTASLEAFATSCGVNFTNYWIFSKLTMTGPQGALSMHTGHRMAGCLIHNVPGNTDSGTVHVDGNDVYVLGNEFSNNGDTVTPSSLYHMLYVSGKRDVTPQVDETNRVVSWNYFHDNAATRAINIYSEPAGAGSDLIKQHHVDHNYITNQRGDGILLGFLVTGDNWVYNNLIVNSGLGPEPSDQGTQHACIDFRAGNVTTTGAASNIMHVFNNTMFNCGFGGGTESGSLVIVRSTFWTPDFHNNIAYQNNSQPYISPGSDSLSANAAQWSNDLWFGAGSTPSFDSSAVNADPQFVSLGLDFHLKVTSPAMDVGTNSGASFVVRDFDGTPQPRHFGKFDLGTYEVP
jgi:hypothetical protein